MDWFDDNPYYLGITDVTGANGIKIDLGERDWMKTHADWMRRSGMWALMRKADDQPVLILIVLPGEQPYYTARHVGVTSSAGGNEITAYGIGKKRLDGHVDRLWVMPNGAVVAGDDVDILGVKMVHALGPK